MKEKYTKPEINVMMNIIISDDQNYNNDNGIQFFANGDLGGGNISGPDDGDL